MHQAGRIFLIVTLSAFAAAGCQLPKEVSVRPPSPAKPKVAVPAIGPAPEACAAEFPQQHSLYTLPPTAAPEATVGKGQPLQWAISHPVDKPLSELGAWRDLGNGWSSIGLRLTSENASGMALRLTKVNLAEAAQIWLCSPDGSTRRGPLRATDGELSAPVIPGAEAWLEVLSPTRNVPRTTLTLAEVFGGFR